MHTEPNGSGATPLRMDLLEAPGIELRARYHSARVGGDFFDALHVGTRIVFLLADIAGRKPDAHPIAAAAQQTFRRRATELYSAPDANLMDATTTLIHELNHAIIAASQGSHFAPTFVGCYDLDLGLMAYINAGGLTAVLRDSDGTRPLGNIAMPMGLFTHLTYEPAIQAFEPGAKLMVVTKGVVETQHGKESFGPERVQKLLADANASAAALCEATLTAAHEFEEVSWFNRHRPGSKRQIEEDLTALVIMRT